MFEMNVWCITWPMSTPTPTEVNAPGRNAPSGAGYSRVLPCLSAHNHPAMRQRTFLDHLEHSRSWRWRWKGETPGEESHAPPGAAGD
jgi:hypothetical protein